MPEATSAELEAILRGAAVAPITDRAFLRITGSDATRWLNGMVTNSIQSLEPGEGNYNFLLNAQGRIQADCTIYREPGEGEPTFLLTADSSQLTAIRETLDRFIIMDDVELSTEGLFLDGVPMPTGVLVLGPEASTLLPKVITNRWECRFEFKRGTLQLASAGGGGAIALSAPEAASLSIELWFSSEIESGPVVSNLLTNGATAVSPAALEAFRIYSGTPRFGTDIRNSETARDLPQETNQTHALHFSKGCYLGQEIVERIRSRGQVHRLFTRFRLEGELPTTFPTPLEVDGKAAGELTSAAIVPLPDGPRLFALGYARREFLDTHRQFTYAGGTATARSASETLTAAN